MLTMKGVSKIYRTDLIETHALRDFSVEIGDGDFVAVTGPSGSGKTTLLNIAGLLESFDDGEYELDGVDMRGLNDDECSELRNEKIGFIFQSFNLMSDLNLFENVDVPLRYRGFRAAERKLRIEESLELVGLSGRMKHLPSQLSGGQQQRVAIARALAGTPKLLLADEPTGNLDSMMARQVLDLMDDINRAGTTIVMVTHSSSHADYARRAINLFDGHVVTENIHKKL